MKKEALVEIITNHAQTGPSAQGVVRNTLSPAFSRLVSEAVRAYMIEEMADLRAHIQADLDSLMGISPPVFAEHVKFSQARINAMIQQLCK